MVRKQTLCRKSEPSEADVRMLSGPTPDRIKDVQLNWKKKSAYFTETFTINYEIKVLVHVENQYKWSTRTFHNFSVVVHT